MFAEFTVQFSYYVRKETSGMCAQQSLKLARASVQSDQSLLYPHEETVSLSIKNAAVKIMINLHECAGGPES